MAMNDKITAKIKDICRFLYGPEIGEETTRRVCETVDGFPPRSQTGERWNQEDAILITYGDSVYEEGRPPLQTLSDFALKHLGDFSTVHILPFFPYSSDDGFSVIDYLRVNPGLGDWKDVEALGSHFDLMFDLVINHVSSRSRWFQNYLQGDSPGAGYFIEVDPQADLSKVIRPRSLPLLTPFQTSRGEKYLWTTFSADQIDLNFANPEVLLEMIRVLLFYLQKGAGIIRLDAIAFLWKEIGTTCLHLPQTHAVVRLLRLIMESAAPGSILLTETNVPNKENLSYFGEGDEAHMVYQFSLPPLLLHALHTGNSDYLTAWAASIPDQSPNGTYFNFTASHDGIGVRPLEGILPDSELSALLHSMQSFGGMVSEKTNPDGSTSPYEINISLYDAFKGDAGGADDFQLPRFLCSQTIMMVLQGIPAFYIHSLLATENDYDGVKRTGMARSINRKKWRLDELERLLSRESHHRIVFDQLRRRIQIRKRQPAFHPNAAQRIPDFGSSFFVVERTPVDGSQRILAVSNVTKQRQEFPVGQKVFKELLSEKTVGDQIVLEPYQSVWLEEHF